MNTTLQGKKGLVVGIANAQSIAWGCARAFRDAGAELAVTWFNDKARPHVEPLAQQLQAPIPMLLDVEQRGQMEAVFAAIEQQWGRLDFVLHSIAFAPKSDLHGRVTDSSCEGFGRAMEPDGPGESGTGGQHALHGGRAGPARHPRQRRFARPVGHACGVGHPQLRRPARRSRSACAAAAAGGYRRGRRAVRLPGQRRLECDDGGTLYVDGGAHIL